MLSGRDTLGHINRNLRDARRQLKRLDKELESASSAATANRKEQAKVLKRVAAIRLDAIERESLAEELDAADRRAESILERRRIAHADAAKRVAAAEESLASIEARRDEIHENVDAAARTLAEREASVQQLLETDTAFQRQLAVSREADAIAVSAAEKVELAVSDRREKGAPFEQDGLFMYLWERGYGTSAYRANPLARWLDGRVGRLCNYHDARPNYWMLLEIPKRLKEHAGQVRAEADAEIDRLQALEDAAARDGGVHDARDDLDDIENAQDAIDQEISRAEAAVLDLRAELGRFVSGDDSDFAEALDVLAAAMQQQRVSELTRMSLATMTVEDDTLVDEFRSLRRRDTDMQQELMRNRELLDEHTRRVRELEGVRREFKRNRFDDLHSRFDKQELILRLIGEVVGGAIRGGALWDALRRYQRYTDVAGEWPDFGSGSIFGNRGRPPGRRPTWHWPGPKRKGRSGGFRIPRAPKRKSRGRGGFRTGGGF